MCIRLSIIVMFNKVNPCLTYLVGTTIMTRYRLLTLIIFFLSFHNFPQKCIMPANMGDNIPKLAGRYMNIIVLGASDSVP